MSLKRRQFTKEFKLQVIREIEAGKSQSEAAREHHLSPNTIEAISKNSRARFLAWHDAKN